MRRDAGTTDSVWPAIHDIPTDGPLEQDIRAEVCIVGAGVVGLCTAYAMMRDGHSVVVIDDGPVGGGETARTTAHISSALDNGFAELARMHGHDGARLAAESHATAIDWLERLVLREGIECAWRRVPGYLVLAEGDSQSRLEREMAAARAAGIEVDLVERAPWPGDAGPALRFPHQAELEPTAFLAGLAKILRDNGVAIHTPVHAARLEEGRGVVTGSGKMVRCRHVVEATNAPVFGHAGVFLKQAAYRTYAIAAPADDASMERALYWDTARPYHYVRLAGTQDPQLIIGGRDHHTGDETGDGDRFAQLEEWARKRLPRMGAVSHRWSGQVWEPVDGLAFIGRAGTTLIATGDSGHGWTHAAIAARLLGDIVSRRENPWAKLYDPHRRTPAAAPSWFKETGHMLGALPRLLMPSEVDDVEKITAGQAALVRRGIRIFACYRDEEGVLHERSAVCKHLGCIVAWNGTERSWDCPCHGSRYDRFGTVINGPSNENLGDQAPSSDGVRVEPEPEARPRRIDGIDEIEDLERLHD